MSYTQEDVLKATRNFTGKTIPVHIEIESKQIVLAQPEMRELLSAADVLAVGNCACREEGKNCKNPLEVCLSFDAEAREKLAKHAWREVPLEEAMALLEETYRLGLVHMAYRRGSDDIAFVCSCCTCCCWPLNGLKAFDYHDAITESAYVAKYDESKCVGCGTCVERCPFDAFAIAEDARKATFSEGGCFGCGLCVGTCPTEAISLKAR